MAKKFLFDLDIEASATFETNAKEFYTKALIGDDASKRSTRYFRNLLVLGEETKVANLLVSPVIQEAGCDFTSTDLKLTQKTIKPEIFNIGVEICQWQSESSFLSAYTGPVGSFDFLNTNGLNPEFEAHLLDLVGKELSANIEQLTWKGNKAGSTGTYLDLADGLEAKLGADADVIHIQSTTLTSSNILTEIEKVYLAVPESLTADMVKIGVSPMGMRLYKLATAKNNTINYITNGLAENLIDFTVIEMPGLSRNSMVAGDFGKNFVYGTDIARDADLNVINMKRTVGERKIRIIGDFKFVVDYFVPEEIVYYGNITVS